MEPEDAPIADWLEESSSDPRAVAQRYDAWARGYDADLDAWSYRAPDVVAETVVSRSADADPVLDVGCGTGLVGRALRARGLTGRIVGLDLSVESLAIARRTGLYASLEQADLQQRLPVESASVDAVVCVGVMTYLPDVEPFWRELARVARPGGLVVVTQREDLWHERSCQAIVDRLRQEEVWTLLEVSGPAPYLPQGYGGTPAVDCYYLTARVGPESGSPS